MIRVSAPGKTILMGEHAAVYGRPALVAALDRRVHVALEIEAAVPAGAVRIDLPGLGISRFESWTNVRGTAAALREAWRQMEEGADDGSRMSRLAKHEDRSLLARIALGEALEALDGSARDDVQRRGLRIEIRSEFPVGSGFGSSAAIAVSVVRAIFERAGRDIADETLQAVSLEIERRQHGSPSGVDNATVIAGGIVWVEKNEGRLDVAPLGDEAVESPILRHLRIVQTGEPAETTGEVVAAVRRRRDRDPTSFERYLETMESSTRAFRELLDTGGKADRAMHEIRRFQSCLEAIGVVPEPVRRRIRRIEELGGAAKISGAGSLAGPGAGSLLVLHPESERLDASCVLDGTERLDVRLGGEGVRIDESTTV